MNFTSLEHNIIAIKDELLKRVELKNELKEKNRLIAELKQTIQEQIQHLNRDEFTYDGITIKIKERTLNKGKKMYALISDNLDKHQDVISDKVRGEILNNIKVEKLTKTMLQIKIS